MTIKFMCHCGAQENCPVHGTNQRKILNKSERETLLEASRILLEISKTNYGVCEAFAFGCHACEVFDLATKFHSFVNFYDESHKK